ncbi:RNA polymerase subunit sigma-70 [Drancourtella sp. An57]|nr:RNA polymerase subunit sigma-70 [Drancourtella sp. An57]
MIKQLYHQYGKELFLYLYSMCQQKELAEDLLQETFLKAILALPEYHTNMRAWLYKVARNLFYNLYKRNRREICDEEYLKKISKLEVDEFLEEYISKQETRILYTAMQKLSPVKREVLELQYFGQMPLKEIANVLQLSQENVRVLSHRAKKDLKKLMEVEGYEVP